MTFPSEWLIYNVSIVLEDRVAHGAVHVKDGTIAAIIEGNSAYDGVPESAERIDGGGQWLLPGFIDVHVHGGAGGDFMDASQESYEAITRFHASQGTTGMLATTMTASKEAIDSVLEAVSRFQAEGMAYAALYGIHLEGPFLCLKWIGAQNPAFLSPPRIDWLEDWELRYPGLVKLVTLAPENEGAMKAIRWLSEHGIVAACGHTDATYDVMQDAANHGLTHAVHTYNAMRPLHHREPGTVGAVLSDDRICAELIADGFHVHPGAIRLLVASKPADKLILVSDAMSAAGMPDGLYDLGGLPVFVKEGVARLKEGNLAGSSLTMINAFRFMLENTSLSVTEVSQTASGNAAKQLGLYETTGSIAVGKRADLVLAEQAFHQVSKTWVNGKLVFQQN
ncbi:N-acetylglucosamine-6-phosphate deacetylase [Paenibacillus radicis (ex Gao et al. 2016)]|uniref:N-acetylglucosamine-6-phosphate deacetylase n=1 Tax=Paenibacillus radicis (ex Gao et al. 2016) TaxID=1737354 RepID=A0A917HCQ3_9BACL|nr:N-acetylglucosamine-6-phosphate deacetylase [Paenibacillus radicis (ex Gao et al. 2016)]GGG74619.1 N-acetylglucosamine-6-phosphate deacetylase [Paenibacillus radicis (ex Gao et al. 2016)]